MICPVCKSNIRDNAAFCPVCGKPVLQDTPDIHNIETVELPNNKEPRVPNPHYQDNNKTGMQKPAERPVQYDTVSREQPYTSPNESSFDKKAEYYVRETAASAETRQQRNVSQDRQVRPSHQYRNTLPQGQVSRTQSQQRPPVRNIGRAEPLSEKESFLLRNSLSKKSVLAFACGIFGICSFSLNLPFAIVGLVMSIIVRNEYRERGWPKDTDLKLSNAAFICSIIGIVLGVIGLIVLLTAGAGILAALSSLSSMASGGRYYGF